MADQVRRSGVVFGSTDITRDFKLSFCHSGGHVNPLSPIMQAQFCQPGELAQSLTNNKAITNEY
jgi:hypothetical protein